MAEFFFRAPKLLTSRDVVSEFDCGSEELNRYLEHYALQSQNSEAARSYVSHLGEQIAGYYSLAYGSVECEQAPNRVSKGMARHPIPVMVLARLAVDKAYARQGLGEELLRDALLRTLSAADIAGLRAVVVDAKNDRAKGFYGRYGFESFPENRFRLALILKDVKALLKG